MPQVSEIADSGRKRLLESTRSAAGIAIESDTNLSVRLDLIAINPHSNRRPYPDKYVPGQLLDGSRNWNCGVFTMSRIIFRSFGIVVQGGTIMKQEPE